jgi:hypothetical protein
MNLQFIPKFLPLMRLGSHGIFVVMVIDLIVAVGLVGFRPLAFICAAFGIVIRQPVYIAAFACLFLSARQYLVPVVAGAASLLVIAAIYFTEWSSSSSLSDRNWMIWNAIYFCVTNIAWALWMTKKSISVKDI